MNWRIKRKGLGKRQLTQEDIIQKSRGKEGSHSGFLCAGAHGDQQGQFRLHE